jgi:hypothetical protein
LLYPERSSVSVYIVKKAAKSAERHDSVHEREIILAGAFEASLELQMRFDSHDSHDDLVRGIARS